MGAVWGGGSAGDSAEVRLTANQSISTSTWTAISWDAEEYDTADFWEGVTNPTRITFGTAGKYMVVANPIMQGNATGQRYARCIRNGNAANELFLSGIDVGAAIDHRWQLSGVVNAAANDYIEVEVWQDAGTLNLLGAAGSDAETTRCFVYRIGGS